MCLSYRWRIPQESSMPSHGGTHEPHVQARQQSYKKDDATCSQAQAGKGEIGQRGGNGNFMNDPGLASRP
jgi:hypothetical protein